MTGDLGHDQAQWSPASTLLKLLEQFGSSFRVADQTSMLVPVAHGTADRPPHFWIPQHQTEWVRHLGRSDDLQVLWAHAIDGPSYLKALASQHVIINPPR